jgi:di/tricarboxylate transporter
MYQQISLTLIIIALIACLFSARIKASWVFAGAISISYLANLIDLEGVLINFTNTSLITLILLILISIGIEKTVFVRNLSSTLAKDSLFKSVAKLGLSTALLSSFTNNTAVVASLISAVKENKTHAPSKLLLPLSYTAILGGTLTLIGTSTNLIVNGFAVEAGMAPLGFFDFTLVGLGVLCVGLTTILLLLRFLPNNQVMDDDVAPFYLEGKVKISSKLIGKTVEENGLRELKDIYLAEIIRGEERITAVTPQQIIKANDTLLFSGDLKAVSLLKQFDGLAVIHEKHEIAVEHLVEVVVSHSSKLVGKTLKQADFRRTYKAAVVAIRRGHSRLEGGFASIQLQAGDSLILAPNTEFKKNKLLKKEFVYISGLELQSHLNTQKSYLLFASFMSVITLSILNIVPLTKGLILLLLGLVVSGVVSVSEIKRRFPLELIIIVGSAIGLAKLMFSSGLATEVSQLILLLAGDIGPYSALIVIFFATLLCTELITNNAAAALSFPIAYSLAVGFDVSPLPFVMAVAFGASASFISPFGYQTNLMVFSAGNYKIKDYIRMGLPISVLYSITALVLIPIVFPF